LTPGDGERTARISVVINTLNEEVRLPSALRSVRDWVDEIVVVDMHSDDRTVEIAEAFGARVFAHERIGYADPAREFALSKATGDWILILDADELIPPRLARRLTDVAMGEEADVVDIPRLNYLLGKPLAWTGWGPTQDRHQRFFKKGWIEATSDIHAYLRLREGARVLELDPADGLYLVHFNYLDVAHFIEKLNRYTTIEAAAKSGNPRPPGRTRVIVATVREFRDRFLRYKGYRDGWRGFYLAGLMAFYRFAVYAKAQELRSVGTREDVERMYDSEAERWLNEQDADR
jgi:glycosyltransferase involved in cell wall biosynthesis